MTLPQSQFLSRVNFGVASDKGGRAGQDDRAVTFSARWKDGSRMLVAAVLDGHHGHHVAELVMLLLPSTFLKAMHNSDKTDLEVTISAALVRIVVLIAHFCFVANEKYRVSLDMQVSTVQSLDDAAYEAYTKGGLETGGTTLLMHVITEKTIFTANVGDCKGVVSSRGAPDALSEAHNPPVVSERERFAGAGVPCFSDHIGGSDINVCRTIGDYDLGPPLKWRDDQGLKRGPLICEPEIFVRLIDPLDEFIVMASDGLWDYYTPESSVITETRQKLRAFRNNAQEAAEWLVGEALSRQRTVLHEGTPGDNVTVVVIQLRPLPQIPRASASRLNLLLRRDQSDFSDGCSEPQASAAASPLT
jgi:serine/threonine protein phosphatase PrpC